MEDLVLLTQVFELVLSGHTSGPMLQVVFCSSSSLTVCLVFRSFLPFLSMTVLLTLNRWTTSCVKLKGAAHSAEHNNNNNNTTPRSFITYNQHTVSVSTLSFIHYYRNSDDTRLDKVSVTI